MLQIVLGSLQFSAACLRVYGHPDLLRVAAAINGDDFVPFNEAVWIKQAGLGGSVAWHQDGWTHWDSPRARRPHPRLQLHGPALRVHVGQRAVGRARLAPMGKVDIKAMVDGRRVRSAARRGAPRLRTGRRGDHQPPVRARFVRQHQPRSTGDDQLRVPSPRARCSGSTSGGVHNAVAVYDDERIDERSKAIVCGIDARAQRFPSEDRYVYEPFAGREDDYRYGPDTLEQLRDYNRNDLGI